MNNNCLSICQRFMRYAIFSLLLIFIGCSQQTPKNLPKKVDQLIAEDKYDQALDVLNNVDASETKANVDSLKEKVHLNYGIFREYQGKDGAEMRDRMNGALRQYVEVLKINPDNQKAISEVQQIMGIYKTMPNKSPDKDIVDALRKLGFDYSAS